MKYVLAMLLLTACASGQEYNGSNAKLVVYQPAGYNYRPIVLEMHGKEVCALGNGGYFETNETGLIESDWTDRPGTSRIVPTGKFVRVTVNRGNELAQAFGGLIVAQATTGGPFIFENVDAATAKRELVGLKRDCE